MKGFADKMTDHQALTNTTITTTTMGLQAHPCSNKRTIEGLEEPAGRAQQHHYNNNNHQQQQQHHQQLHSGPRAAKQQCTIRVGVEAPDHLAQTLVPGNCASGTESLPNNNNNNWYRDVQQQQPTAPDYETYVNGFNAAEVRASTPYSASSNNTYYSTGTSTHSTENVAVPAVEYSYANNNNNGSNNEVQYSSQNVYQNLTSMLPVANGGGESLADRFERVCSSPRPYVQYSGREEPAGYHYGSNESVRSDERYWTFGYTSTCPKKTGAGYAKCNNYNGGGYGENGFKPTANGYQQQQQLTTGGSGQTIQRDENGKSYLELGAKAAVQPEWVRPQIWNQAASQHHQQQQQQQHYGGAPAVKSCSKCGHVLMNPRSLPQPCYRHQRLSVLSLSMLKLNRYRQCSDPSLHRSVLICNTLRHIEDEMEREGLVCNPSAETTTAVANNSATSNCDTCCCSHCGTVFNNTAAAAAKPDNTPPTIYNNTTTTNSSNVYENNTTSSETNFVSDYGATTNSQSKSNSVVNADEDDSGFGDEDSRDIDWSSVFSMSTASGFDVSAAGNSNASSSSDSYLCDSNSSDPSLFAGASGPELVSELGLANWKSSHCGSATSGHSGVGSSWTSDSSSDFSGVRWKSELGDELEGFVHILVGS